ncbi:hypothetical protein GWI33_014278 [Rhynchophorus ferrugineus]|uniref:Uncharacterized protein n=1 Tax=Rhynchophorus ferrugineus TaxID=354439 RepID=A0A834I7I9_RHYFE|nr:hypothetical protein GWI33_014278 [Rhynchophorus ferrugineus]
MDNLSKSSTIWSRLPDSSDQGAYPLVARAGWGPLAAPARGNGGRRGSARSSVESRNSVLDTIMENTKIVETDSTIDFEFYRRGLRGLSATELADVMKDLKEQNPRREYPNENEYSHRSFLKVLKAKSAIVMTNTTKVESITNAEAMVKEMINTKLTQIQHETNKRIQRIESLLQDREYSPAVPARPVMMDVSTRIDISNISNTYQYLYVPSAVNIKVKNFKQARVNGGSNYDSLKEGHQSVIQTSS